MNLLNIRASKIDTAPESRTFNFQSIWLPSSKSTTKITIGCNRYIPNDAFPKISFNLRVLELRKSLRTDASMKTNGTARKQFISSPQLGKLLKNRNI